MAGASAHMLSGGRQRRVALARALAPSRAVLLLDEPFSGLDTRLRQDIRDRTLHAVQKSGAATLLVTHDPEEAMFMGDRIAVMRAGRLEQVDSPQAVYLAPRTGFVAGFVGDVNERPALRARGRVEAPVGPLPDDGGLGPVRALIRPEALSLTPSKPRKGSGKTAARPRTAQHGTAQQSTARHGTAQVTAARMLGRTSLIHLDVDSPQFGPVHLHARVPGVFLPEPGSHVTLRVDPSLAFVFPADDAT